MEDQTPSHLRPWQRPGWEVAQSTKLLDSTVTLVNSEIQLDSKMAAVYGMAIDFGRMAANGILIMDLHPGQFLFSGHRFILSDWGEHIQVELKAPAFLAWLADMRAAWAPSFAGFLAGFIQGLRAATATSHPELARELIKAVGGTLAPSEPAWPLREGFAAQLHCIKIRNEVPCAVADLSLLLECASDTDEKAALSLLAKSLGADIDCMRTRALSLRFNFPAFSNGVRQLTNAPNHHRQLWLLVFLLTDLGNKACDFGYVAAGNALLQAGQLALQCGVGAPQYFESALACCIHRESQRVRIPAFRSSKNEVFSCLGYSNSRAATCIEMFQASRKCVESGHAKTAMWTAIWNAIERLRESELAFVAWAATDASAYSDAAPALQSIARTHTYILAEFAESLNWAAAKSLQIPCLLGIEMLIPKLEQEFNWCRSIIEIVPGSPDFHAVLQSKFSAAPRFIDSENHGINSISFLRAKV